MENKTLVLTQGELELLSHLIDCQIEDVEQLIESFEPHGLEGEKNALKSIYKKINELLKEE